MAISSDSKSILQREILSLNAGIDDLDKRIKEAKQKRDPLNDMIQKLQDEKQELQRKKQSIMADVP